MISEELEKALNKTVENYFKGMSAKEAISESLSKGSDILHEKYQKE